MAVGVRTSLVITAALAISSMGGGDLLLGHLTFIFTFSLVRTVSTSADCKPTCADTVFRVQCATPN